MDHSVLPASRKVRKTVTKRKSTARKPASNGDRRAPLKIAEEIARDIVRDIADRKLTTGAPLPHEKTMIAQYGVGRASIREALRIIEAQGLIFLKPGRNGGPVLVGTGPERMARVLSLFLGLSNATYRDLGNFMLTVSPGLAESAAANPDRAAVRKAIKLTGRNPCAMVDSHKSEDGFELGPHAMINKLSTNPILAMFADAVDAVFQWHSMEYTKGEGFLDIAERDHHAIAVAVIEGKPERARQLMRKHVERIIEYTDKKAPKFLSQRIEWK